MVFACPYHIYTIFFTKNQVFLIKIKISAKYPLRFRAAPDLGTIGGFFDLPKNRVFDINLAVFGGFTPETASESVARLHCGLFEVCFCGG
jgi:hypothetical protein